MPPCTGPGRRQMVGRTSRAASLRVVLDTNVVLSALVFRNGRLSWIRRAWQSGRITPVVCRRSVDELLRVLAYPKFRLGRADIDELLADFLPYTETAESSGVSESAPRCRDPQDQMFIELLLATGATALISGDADLTDLAESSGLAIWTPSKLRHHLGAD
jgi:uncharacterized protein